MLFETKKKADTFILFNREEIQAESGYAPQRSYFCVFCDGWHITSMTEFVGKSQNEQLLENYLTETANKKTTQVDQKGEYQEIQNQAVSKLDTYIKGLDHNQIELYFTEHINSIKQEIDACKDSPDKLKELRQELDILYIVRKRNGFKPPNHIYEEKLKERQSVEWKRWYDATKSRNRTNETQEKDQD